MTSTAPVAAPTEVVLGANRLDLRWGEEELAIDARHLREHCRCASCKQLAAEGRPVITDTALQLVNASPVGGYGLQLHFSDGHERGIYPWSYLRELAEARQSAGAHKPADTSLL